MTKDKVSLGAFTVNNDRCESSNSVSITRAPSRASLFRTQALPENSELQLTAEGDVIESWRSSFCNGDEVTIAEPAVTYRYARLGSYVGQVVAVASNSWDVPETIPFFVEVSGDHRSLSTQYLL